MDLKYQIKIMRKRDPSIKNNFEILLYPGFWILIFHFFAHKLYRNKFFFSARVISQFGRFLTGIEIHPGANIGRGLFIDHGAGVVIGETAKIGNDVVMYQNVTLGGTGKDLGKRHPTIGHNVLIGAGSKILGPILIGSNSRIGAGSVVLHPVKSYSTVVGIPARAVARDNQEMFSDDEMLQHSHLPDPITADINRIREQLDDIEKRCNSNHKSA